MAIGKRTSRAVLVLLLVATLSVSSNFVVEATTSANQQLSRQLPTRRVRGLKRDIKIDDVAVVENLKAPTKDKSKTSRHKPHLPKFFRPVPEEFDDLGLTPKLAARPSKNESKLPESQQATDIKVNKKSGNGPKPGVSSASQKGYDLTEISKSNKKSGKDVVENGLEHFHEGE